MDEGITLKNGEYWDLDRAKNSITDEDMGVNMITRGLLDELECDALYRVIRDSDLPEIQKKLEALKAELALEKLSQLAYEDKYGGD